MLATMGMAFPFAAHAGTDIVIDFGSSVSTPGGNVNNVTPDEGGAVFTSGQSGFLKDYSTGLATTVKVGWSTSGGDFFSDWPTSRSANDVWSGSSSDWLADSLTSDFIGSSSEGATLTITLTGLSAGTYSLSLLSSGDTTAFSSGVTSELITVQVGSGSTNSATSEANGGTDRGTGWDTVASGEGLNDYLIWDNLVVGDGDTITITDNSVLDGSGLVALNGMRITAVPEPAETAVFFGTLALMGAWFHRRKKTTVA
jgi:hypothetical protein